MFIARFWTRFHLNNELVEPEHHQTSLFPAWLLRAVMKIMEIIIIVFLLDTTLMPSQCRVARQDVKLSLNPVYNFIISRLIICLWSLGKYFIKLITKYWVSFPSWHSAERQFLLCRRGLAPTEAMICSTPLTTGCSNSAGKCTMINFP